MRALSFLMVLFLSGCPGLPNEEYVQADAKAWEYFDPYIDDWIDGEPKLKKVEKMALHSINDGRRARIRHQLEAIRANKSSD